MKSNEKIMIAILVVITAVVVIAFVVTRNKDTKGGTSTQGTSTSEASTSGTKVDDYVTELPDATKENTSEKIKETKKLDENLEVSDLKLTKKDGRTMVEGTIKNVSSKAIEESGVEIILLDKDGEELGSIPWHLKSLEPEETTSIQAERTLDEDAINAYDLKIVRE